MGTASNAADILSQLVKKMSTASGLYFFHFLALPAQYAEQGPDLQNILRQSYDYLTIMPKLRSTYDGRLVCKTCYSEWKAFHR